MVKQVDEGLAYHFLICLIYWVLTLFLAFFLSISFEAQAGLGSSDTNYATVYLPIKIVFGTIFTIFNEATEALLLFEGKNGLNLTRQLATSFL